MAHGIGEGKDRVRVHQALHGYSDGHRLLASSVSIPGRDARTMLMMSDASGPAASIDDRGYLTAYPLAEAGYFAIGRTWDAPEMSRPGCVWTHTLLINFSDLPSLATAAALLPLFRRPFGSVDRYEVELSAYPTTTAQELSCDDASVRHLLWGLYARPKQPVISSWLADADREAAALAIWDQQWPRLKRSFRFCTLSFADRSAPGAPFDLQFLPARDRTSRAQFQNALDLDRSLAVSGDWLDEAMNDLREGLSGELRQFLKETGGDTGGRDAFVPLVELYMLSRDFGSKPQSVEQAMTVIEKAFPPSQARVTRAFVARVAGNAPETLDAKGLDFIVRNWDLLQESEARDRAAKVGAALWAKSPSAVGALLSDSGPRRGIAESAVGSMKLPELIEGLGREPDLIPTLLSLRPDLTTSRSFWSLRRAWDSNVLQTAFGKPDAVRSVLSSMIGSADDIPIGQVCRTIGDEAVLRAAFELLDASAEPAFIASVKPWLSASSSDANVVAKVLSEGLVRRLGTLDMASQVVSPDFVPNQVGEDPWLTAWRAIKTSEQCPLYLFCFLLTRALGNQSRNQAELIGLAFDPVYSAAQASQIPNAAWRLLDGRLPVSYFWQSWDLCQRIRSGVVDAFVDRWLAPEVFLRVTEDQQVFKDLVDLTASSYGGRRYLRHVGKSVSSDHRDRLRLIEEKFEW